MREDLLREVRVLSERAASVEFVKNRLTFAGKVDPMSKLMLTLLAVFGEFDRELIREPQRVGIPIAKTKGVCTGRKWALTPGQAKEIVEQAYAGMPRADLARRKILAEKRFSSCSWKTASRSMIGILLRQPLQMYLGVLDGTYISRRKWQKARPAKRWTAILVARVPVPFRSSRMALHSAHMSSGTIGSTEESTHSLSGFSFQAFLLLVVWV